MDDLVERLRAWEPLVSSGYEVPAAGQVMFQAADRIEALQARIAELEAGQSQAMVKGAELMREAAARVAREFHGGAYATLDSVKHESNAGYAVRGNVAAAAAIQNRVKALSPSDVVKATPLTQ